MNAMILAAGLGTRLRPLTDSIPKALVEVDGVPIIDRTAAKIVSEGARTLVINAHHRSSQLLSHIIERGGYGVRCCVSMEKELLDTGGGILRARPFLEGGGAFVVHNVDILSNLSLEGLRAGAGNDSLACLAVSRRESSRKLLFDSTMRLVGWTDLRSGEVRSPFGHINPAECSQFAFSGIHLISDKVFDVMDEFAFGGSFPIMDFYLTVAARYRICGYVQEGLRVLDIGKPEALAKAGELLRDGFCE